MRGVNGFLIVFYCGFLRKVDFFINGVVFLFGVGYLIVDFFLFIVKNFVEIFYCRGLVMLKL